MYSHERYSEFEGDLLVLEDRTVLVQGERLLSETHVLHKNQNTTSLTSIKTSLTDQGKGGWGGASDLVLAMKVDDDVFHGEASLFTQTAEHVA